MSPMDKYLATDKDNMFVGWKWTTVDQMSYMRDATLTYELETNTGFSVKAMARHRNDQPAGMLQYWKNNGPPPGEWDEEEYPGARHHHHRTRSDPALPSRRNVCQHQATPCSRVAGRPHVHPSRTPSV